ncbi:hypothetical protein AB0A76_00960 [Streptomyces exfoliatus]|uniref:Uncharacterized protein n=1 Tax=Streptomyces exfoliatus TaxID=1905 RepID=A0ABV3CNJ1_STREX
MTVRKRIVVLTAALLGALCGSIVTAGLALTTGDGGAVSVESHTAEKPTREEVIRLWETALAKSGKKLPAGVDKMADQEIFEAMWSESRKHLVPERPPTVFAD